MKLITYVVLILFLFFATSCGASSTPQENGDVGEEPGVYIENEGSDTM